MPLLDDFTNGLRNLYGNGGPGDPLIGLGMGLLSQRGGQGLAAGMQNVAQMTDLTNQRKRQEMLDKLAQERETRQAANQAWQQQWQQRQAENQQKNADRSFNLQMENAKTSAANVAADNARQAEIAARPFVIGKDKYGREIYGTSKNGVFTPVDIPQVNQSPAAPVSDLHGDAYLGTVDPQIKDQVLAIAQGRAPYPNQAFMKTPLGEQIVNAVQQYDPTFEAGNAAARLKMQTDASTGKMGQNNNALNTALGHLMELSDKAQGLNNWQSPLANTAKNWINTNVLGDSSVTNFNTVRDKVAEEFTRVYRGAGGSESDIKREISNLNAANSPKQLNEAIAAMADLARSKIEANQEQYKTTMGPLAKPREMISEKSKGVLSELTKRASPISTSVSYPSWSIEK